MRRLLDLGVASLLALGACKKKVEEPHGSERGAEARTAEHRAAIDSDVLRGLQSLGEEYALVGVLRPSAWKAFHQRLDPLFRAMPELHRAWQSVARPEQLSLLVARDVFAIGDLDPSVPLAGFDGSRPLLFGAMRSSLPDRPTGGLTAEAWNDIMRVEIGNEILFPATDPAALIESLDHALAEAGDPKPELVAGLAGARARHGQVLVVLMPGDREVRLVARAVGGTATREHVAERLAPPVPAQETTPALLAAAQSKAAAAVVIRGWHLRKLGTSLGAIEAARAMATVSRDAFAGLAATVQGILLTGEAVMSDAPAEFDDWAWVASTTSSGVAFRTVASATPTGRAILDAAKRTSAFALKVRRPALDARIPLDLRPALAKATEPAFASALERCSETTEMVQENGHVALPHLFLRAPFGTMALAGRLASPEGDIAPPSSMHLVLTTLTRDRVEGALAIELPTGNHLAPLRALVSGEASPMVVHEGVRDGKPVLLLGWGLDPTTIFDLSEAGEPGRHLATATAEISAPGLASVLGSLHVGAWLRHEDDALVYDMVASTAGAPSPPDLPDLGTARWSSPRRVVASEAAEACLTTYVVGTSRMLQAVTRTDPSMWNELLAHAQAELEAPFACASKDDQTAPVVQALRGRALDVALGAALAEPDFEHAAMLLRKECSTTADAKRCRQAETLESSSPASTTRLDVDCDWSARGETFGIPVRVLESGFLIGADPVGATREAIDEALEAHAVMTVADRTILGAVIALAPPDVEFSRIRPLLDALVARDAELVHLAFASAEGTRSIRAALVSKREAMPASAVLLKVDADGISLGSTGPLRTTDPAAIAAVMQSEATHDSSVVIQPGDDARWSDVLAAAAATCHTSSPVLLVQ
jgi:hypothetical protein